MRLRFRKIALLTALPVLSAGVLSSCDFYEPGTLSHQKIQAVQEEASEDVPLAQADAAYLRGLADQYRKSSTGGPMQVTVAYDPAAPGGAAHAKAGLARVLRSLNQEGVTTVSGSVLPVHAQREEHLVVAYRGYKLLPPPDCGLMEGINSRDVVLNKDYRLGCTVDTLLSRQIANPKDMTSDRASDGVSDGRRAANIIDIYRSGAPSEKLEGETASEE